MEFDNSFTVPEADRRGLEHDGRPRAGRAMVPGARVIEKTGDRAVNAEVKIQLGACR